MDLRNGRERQKWSTPQQEECGLRSLPRGLGHGDE